MLMDKVAHVNERVDGHREEIKKVEKDIIRFQEWTLVVSGPLYPFASSVH
jgi:hypothetical protein